MKISGYRYWDSSCLVCSHWSSCTFFPRRSRMLLPGVYAESMPELSEALIHADTFDAVVGALSITLMGFFVTQIPLTISGVALGLAGKKASMWLWPSKRPIETYGDFTSEGITKSGVVKVRVLGTVPEELVDWMQKEIARQKEAGYQVIATFQHFEYYTYFIMLFP